MIKAYCINLDRKPENFEKVTKEFRGLLAIKRVSAVDGSALGISPSIALHRTVTNLFAEVIKTDEPYAIVLEDDIYRCEDFDKYWPKIFNFIHDSKNVWDFISLDFFLAFDKPILTSYNDFLFSTTNFRSCGFMIYNINFLKKYCSELQSYGPLDMTMTYDSRFVKLIPKSLIVRQYINKKSEINLKNDTEELYKNYYEITETRLSSYNGCLGSILLTRSYTK